MRNFVILALLGFCAQLVDGALGMAYGATSSTLLVGVAGLTPAIASTAVHLGEVGTTAASAFRTGGSGTWTGRRSCGWPYREE